MSSFKEQLEADINDVFFNMDEFGSVHDVNGVELPVVIHEDVNNAHEGGSNRNFDGLSSDSPIVAIKREGLGEKLPAYGQNFKLDGKLYKVKSVSDEMGVVHIQLMSYRGGGAR